MALTMQVHTQRVSATAEQMQNAARHYGQTFDETFGAWADSVGDAMREEIPKDTHETSESVTVEYRSRGPLKVARIGPTNTDSRGRPIGFYINYGAAGRPPVDFIGSTRLRAEDVDFDVGSVL